MMERLPMQSQNPTPEESTRLLYKNWRERLALPLLIGVLIFGAAALIPAIRASGNAIVNAIFITSYAMTALVTVVKFPYTVRMGVFIACIYVIGLGELFLHGILGDSLFFFLAVVIFATILLSPRIGISMIGINLLTLLLVGFLMLSQQFTPFNPFAAPAKVEDWLSAGAAILMFSAVIILGFQRLEQEFIQAQKQIDATLTSLKEERGNLEQKVLERTVLLQKVNEVGQSITAILDPDEVLSNAARHINDEFDCYYTAFYLMDSSGHWAELKEATGEAGRVLRENRYRLDVNGKNLVAKAVRERLGQIASEEDAQQARVDNPLLPYTRSQIVLPLVVGNKLLGALEMHATKEGALLFRRCGCISKPGERGCNRLGERTSVPGSAPEPDRNARNAETISPKYMAVAFRGNHHPGLRAWGCRPEEFQGDRDSAFTQRTVPWKHPTRKHIGMDDRTQESDRSHCHTGIASARERPPRGGKSVRRGAGTHCQRDHLQDLGISEHGQHPPDHSPRVGAGIGGVGSGDRGFIAG
jgi:hypothetical protein